MEYSISEVSRLLKITRKTVYNKIEKLEDIQPHIVVRGKNKYIKQTGVDIIQKSLLANQNTNLYTTQEYTSCSQYTNEIPEKESSNKANFNDSDKDTTSSIQLVYNLQKHIQELSTQLSVKDKQIHSLTEALETSQKLNENNQILLRESQQRVLLLEQYNQSKKTWWKKFFS